MGVTTAYYAIQSPIGSTQGLSYTGCG